MTKKKKKRKKKVRKKKIVENIEIDLKKLFYYTKYVVVFW